jgi:signal transduction histidine kinase/DNA-binding response OmpR family regulator/CHASE3 domain sensor protein
MRSTIKRNLFIGFSISMILLLISSVASYNSIRNLMYSNGLVNHTDSVMQGLEESISILKDAETGQRGFLLTGDEKFLQPYNGAYERSLDKLTQIMALTADNPVQQATIKDLKEVIVGRLSALEKLIEYKRKGLPIDLEYLEAGKRYMDEARKLVAIMESRERVLLDMRMQRLSQYATYTPVVIVSAAVLSLLITIVFFSRIVSDVDKRAQLQKELEDKDIDITNRINIIQNLAEQIASGDYSIRIKDSGADTLGSLAGLLNKMTSSLEYSFKTLSEKEWLQAGIAGLNNKMLGDKSVHALATEITDFAVAYTGSQSGAYYLLSEQDTLILEASYALNIPESRQQIKAGEGLAGQALSDGKEIIWTNIKDDQVVLSYSGGGIRPGAVIAIPTYNQGAINGVLELHTLSGFADREIEFLKAVSGISGISIASAQSRKKLQELLEETQAQSEELQAQQSELEALNTELETQTESLQASEEELKVQQAELQQSNMDLEERSRLLEERNQMIAERNIEIQQKAEQLEQSTRYKSEFLANMSHELRTPLNSILLLSRLLSENNEKNLSEEQIESAKVIQSSGNGLLSLIDEILDLSKIEAGKMDVDISKVAIGEIVDDMRSLFDPIARDKKIELRFNLMQPLPQIIETDKLRLEQILRNLLSNAIKFTSEGYVALDIVIAGSDDHPAVSFKVVDTGIGIPEDKQALVFEAFRQADGSTKRKYGGTGLGLSISRELSRLLGGHITLESTPGQGSTFTVTIPVTKGDVLEAPLFEKLPVVGEESAEFQRALKENSDGYLGPEIPADIPDDRDNIKDGDSTVLIVEDDTNFASALLSFTRRSGYKGVVCVRGDMALSFAHKYRPIAILLDIMLPVMNGWQVMDELKSDPKTRHIPVHIMSSTDARKESLLSGAVDFINKPVALEQMQQMFGSLKEALTRDPKKVLIIEENPRHAKALEYYLESFHINAEIRSDIRSSVNALQKKEVDCVILDMGVPDQSAYETLETVKKTPGFEKLPIIVFTGKNLSRVEESRIKQYADSIVLKTAHSYQRILDEVGLFLHLVEGQEQKEVRSVAGKKLELEDVLKGKKVLIADDDVRNIFSLTKALEHSNMKVISAMDGRDAIQQMVSNPDIDVVLMDMMMPEMDGYESIRKIRQMPAFRSLPILAVTAKAMTGDRNKCIAAGASDYISKPVDIDQLLSLLRVWLYESKGK